MKPGIGNYLSIVAILGMSLPANAFEDAAATQPQRVITDVALTESGDLLGAVVQKNGHPLAGQTVQIMSQNKIIALAKTDTAGRYRIKGLRSGVHQINTRHQQQVCRIWTQAAAPPTAQKGLITAQSQAVVLGQNGDYVEFGSSEIIGLAIFGGATAATLISTLGSDSSSSVTGSGSGGLGGGGGDTASP